MVIRFGTVNISGSGRSLEIGETADEIDVTTYGSDDREYIPGMVDRDASLDVLDDDTNTTVREAVRAGMQGSLTWFPLGTASGNPKFQVGTAVILERNFTYPYDDAVLMSVRLRLSGNVTETTASGAGL